MLSDWLIASGPLTYVVTWLIVLVIIVCYQPSKVTTAGLITYAALPIGAIIQSGCGYMLALVGF